MKTIIGAAIGVLAIGLVLIGAGLRGTASAPAAFLPTNIPAVNGNLVPVNDTGSRAAAAGPVMINCAAGQRALVRQVILNGEPVSQVACVADASSITDYGDADAPLVRRVSYDTPRASRLAERRVAYQEPVTRRIEQPKRSWQKRLLVIGGSTAAGAGVGGLIGGKKGALIGAALGGGASTLYEATKGR